MKNKIKRQEELIRRVDQENTDLRRQVISGIEDKTAL
jgi:hypothetical protein